MKLRIAKALLFFIVLVPFSGVHAQTCDSKFLSLSFRTPSWQKFHRTAFSSNNDIVVTGEIIDNNGAGHIARFNRSGIPLWSNDYTMSYSSLYIPLTFLSDITFQDFVFTDDGGMLVCGASSRYYRDANTEVKKPIAVLAKIDALGNVAWSKTYIAMRGIPALGFNSIYKTAEGDFIIYLSIDNGPSISSMDYSYNRVMCFDGNGTLKWSTHLATGEYDSGGKGVFSKKAITQTTNGNIVIGDAVYKTERDSGRFKFKEARLHFSSIDHSTGKISWESSLAYTLPASDTTFVPDIELVRELPGGNLCFTTSLYVRISINDPFIKKPVSLITDNKGILQKLVAYTVPGNETLQLTEAKANEANGINYLFRKGNISVLSSIRPDGTVESSNGYSGTFPPNCFAKGAKSSVLFFSNNQASSFELLIPDADGKLDCAETPVAITEELINVNQNDPAAVSTFTDVFTTSAFPQYFTDGAYGLKKLEAYPLNRTVTCEQQNDCCHDVIDSVNSKTVHLCEGSSYTLPGNFVVSDSGSYPGIFKTARGCDSIIYYTIKIDKNIAQLSLGNDTCMADLASALLRATPGFANYNWIGAGSATDTMRIFSTGQYWVRVSNICGSKTDTVTIYDQCDFPVYMPDAFTPNNDQLNDDFGFPSVNKNRFVNLRIFNRWGQIVFETNHSQKKWNGRFRDIPLPSDVYVYVLTIENLSGNRRIEKGKVVLIR